VEIARAAHVRWKAPAHGNGHAGVFVGGRAERPFEERRVVDHSAPATAAREASYAGDPARSGVLDRDAGSGVHPLGHRYFSIESAYNEYSARIRSGSKASRSRSRSSRNARFQTANGSSRIIA